MDSDGQCDPADMIRLAAPRSDKFDLVMGWRNPRNDVWIRKAMPGPKCGRFTRCGCGVVWNTKCGGSF